MSNILPIHTLKPRRTCSGINRLLFLLPFAASLPAFAVQPTSILLKAVPNQTTVFSPSALSQSATASAPVGIALPAPYSNQNGTVTLCENDISYTPASGFTGTDSFAVTITNSVGAVSSTTATVVVRYVPTLAMQPDHTVQLHLLGAAGSTYNIQASTNFIDWTTVGSSVAGTNGVLSFTDTNAANFPSRYYRVSP